MILICSANLLLLALGHMSPPGWSPVTGEVCVGTVASSARTSPGSQCADLPWDQAVLGGPGCSFLLWLERVVCRVK